MKKVYLTFPLAVAATFALNAAAAFASPSVQVTRANYPGDAPGTMPIEVVAKSTNCQMHGFLRYSQEAKHCVND